MKNPVLDLEKFRRFLESIPLEKYRKELKDIKWVEQDLPKGILPLDSIFRYYWQERCYFDFDDWFEKFWDEINTNPESKKVLSEFKKYFFDKNCEENGWFKKGFKARMYRTWVSVLTQLDFCYVFEYISAKEDRNILLECNAELDAKGIDVIVNNIGFQIAKISQRKEARTTERKKKVITVPYAVFNIEEFKRKSESPKVKNREGYKRALAAFYRYFAILNNGFVVFSENYIIEIIKNINDAEKVIKVVDKISKELSGEG